MSTPNAEPNPNGPWAECIGMKGEDCVDYIKQQAPDLALVKVLPPDSMVTMDYRTDRVWVWVNEQGIVEQAPSRG